jgi:SPP1 family predicted phage head-tail adaptor
MPKLNAGRLRHRLRIEAPTHTQNATTGALVTAWYPVAEHVAAAIEPLSARDLIAAQSVKSQVTTRIVIRFRADLTPAMRLINEATGTIYTPVGILPDPESGREYLTIPASC